MIKLINSTKFKFLNKKLDVNFAQHHPPRLSAGGAKILGVSFGISTWDFSPIAEPADRVTSSVVCVIKDGGSVMRVVGVKSIVIRSEEFASNVKTEYNGFTNK